MEEYELLETIEQEELGPNNTLNTMCILGYVGNAFWLLIFIIFGLMSTETLLQYIPVNNNADIELLMTIIAVVIWSFAGLCVLSIVGLILAQQRKLSGVILYAIGNGIWVIFNVISFAPFNMFMALVSLAFIIVIGIQYRK